jgi:hypothetical protein
MRLWSLAVLAAFAFGAGGAKAEVQKFMNICGTQNGIQKLCWLLSPRAYTA